MAIYFYFFPSETSVPCSAVDCRYGRFVFGGSIIYIVASCAVVVIVVSSVVMTLACRICSQRSDVNLSRLPEGCEFQRNFISAAMHQRVSFVYFYFIFNSVKLFIMY